MRIVNEEIPQVQKSIIEQPKHMPSVVGYSSYGALKDSNSNSVYWDTASFWTSGSFGRDNQQTARGGGYTVTITPNTLIPITSYKGKGTLTHLLSAESNASQAKVTFHVIADGKKYIFTRTIDDTYRVCVGGFLTGFNVVSNSSTADRSMTYGSYNDEGWHMNQRVIVLSPDQALYENIGLDFDENIEVYVEYNKAMQSASYRNYTGASYVKR